MTQSEVREALKPCPFCGGDEAGWKACKTGAPKLEELSEGGWRVTCYTCCYSLHQPTSRKTRNFATRGEAIAAWNTRSHPHAEIERLLTDVRASFWVGRSIHQGENEYLDEIWQRLTDGGSDAG